MPDVSARPRLLDPLWSALRAARALLSILGYFVVASSGIVPWLLFRLLARGTRHERARQLQRASCLGGCFMHWWLRTIRVIRFDWREVRLDLPPGPCVVVANHPTQLDPTVLMALLVNACSLVKPSVYRARLVRPLLEGAMHVEGPSLDPASLAQVLAGAQERLRAGMHLFVFPEAKRSPQGELREFGRIAFEIACRADVPLVSLAIRCEPCYLSRETPLLRPPARLPRVSVEQFAIDLPASVGHDSRALKDRVEARYRQWVADGMPPLAGSAGSAGEAPAPSRSSIRPATGS